MVDIARFWLDVGLDGFRLDAVPYLFAREGTNCENLPETHAFVAELRDTIDREYGEASAARRGQPVARGRGRLFRYEERPECHMAFHFPLMPRMFMAAAPGATLPDHRDPGARPRRSHHDVAVGRSSCATTTS